MSDIDSIAELSRTLAQTRLANAVGIKVLKIANEQQQSVATLIDAAVRSAEQVDASAPGGLDIQA